ncbi:MAG: EthD family reductase [Sphingomicrobium sp.]
MATLSVVYPRTPGATFDYDYYQATHMPLVGERWSKAGLTGGEALLGKAAPDGSAPPYFAIGIIHFDGAESLQAALNGEDASEIIADIRNFTNAEPVIQINDRFVPPS